MAITRRSTVREVAAHVSQALTDAGITAVLTGGSAVSVYSANRYRSYDIDFVTGASLRELGRVMAEIGFTRGAGRHFEHPYTRFVVEFVAWPVTVGDELVRKWARIRTPAGSLQILTPTQCVKDRLAAFFHWRDSQGLEQALLVGRSHRVSMTELARWSDAEGHAEDFAEFRRRLQSIRRKPGLPAGRVTRVR
ncbi:MAG: hypothetical protein IT486_07515 [Gammaproteobacteria bacterium]|nr:hypothetical protein [Gammaproteobacteria bacterium]